MHHATTLEEIVRWTVALGGVLVCVVAITHCRRWQNKIVVVFPVLMATGISINYIHGSPVVFPGAFFYLSAYAYLLWSAWKSDKHPKRKTD